MACTLMSGFNPWNANLTRWNGKSSPFLDMEKLCKDLQSMEKLLQWLRHLIEHCIYALFDVILKQQRAVAGDGIAIVSITRTTRIH